MSRRLRRAHARFLDSCRNLQEGRDYWAGLAPWKRWLLQTIVPVPLLSLLPDGQRMAEALDRLERDCRTRPLAEDVLRDYHRGLLPADGGAYRTGAVTMTGSTVVPPPPQTVGALMRRLAAGLAERQKAWDASAPALDDLLREGMDVYQRLGFIHPFRDGNGRVARLALNHLFRRYGRPYVILPPLSESPELMAALQDGHRGTLDGLVRIGRARLCPV